METTLVTTIEPDPNACTPPAGTTAVPCKQMLTTFYKFTDEDLANGIAQFRLEFTNLTWLLPNSQGECIDKMYISLEANVSVVATPGCSIAPVSSNVWVGAPASFTATGSGPVEGQSCTFIWTGPNGFAQTNTNVLASTVTIDNASVANAGTYSVTVKDKFGCTATGSASLNVSEPPVLSIAQDSNVVVTVIGPTSRWHQIESSPFDDSSNNWMIRSMFLMSTNPFIWTNDWPLTNQSFYRAVVLP